MAKNARLIEMAGKRFGSWQVITQAGNHPAGGALWSCLCSCGVSRVVSGADLRAGKSVSCGHDKAERMGSLRRSHGATGTRLYTTWQNMRRRCADKNNKDYGGRGITVSPAWGRFDDFRAWALSSGYQENLSIERVDVNGNYEPGNCTWADDTTQSANRRFVKAAPDGELWRHKARANGISNAAYTQRVHAGWPMEDAVTWPMGKRRKTQVRGTDGKFA